MYTIDEVNPPAAPPNMKNVI
ncbi:hypothetical protein HALO156_180001 [Halomonas sp. 156]|nr:hypothetical protein HALO156_180001 [Halomonas sp. 156]